MSIILDDMFANSSYLHGDFHTGNYGIIIDNNSFKVVLYDFGLIIKNIDFWQKKVDIFNLVK
jgi:predicted unusual protein kinase regulating ubiquinone biosynthesis (AarF/ABC1/UbiB family)